MTTSETITITCDNCSHKNDCETYSDFCHIFDKYTMPQLCKNYKEKENDE